MMPLKLQMFLPVGCGVPCLSEGTQDVRVLRTQLWHSRCSITSYSLHRGHECHSLPNWAIELRNDRSQFCSRGYYLFNLMSLGIREVQKMRRLQVLGQSQCFKLV